MLVITVADMSVCVCSASVNNPIVSKSLRLPRNKLGHQHGAPFCSRLEGACTEGVTKHVPDQSRRRSSARAAVKHCKRAGQTLFAPCDFPTTHCLDALAHCSGACRACACVDAAAVRELLVDAQHRRCCRGRHRAVRGLDGRAMLRRLQHAARAWRGAWCRLAGEAVDAAGGTAGLAATATASRDSASSSCRATTVGAGAAGSV